MFGDSEYVPYVTRNNSQYKIADNRPTTKINRHGRILDGFHLPNYGESLPPSAYFVQRPKQKITMFDTWK